MYDSEESRLIQEEFTHRRVLDCMSLSESILACIDDIIADEMMAESIKDKLEQISFAYRKTSSELQNIGFYI